MESSRSIVTGIGGWEHEVLDSCFYASRSLDALNKLVIFARSFDFVEVRPTFWDNTLTARDAADWVAAVSSNRRFQFGVKLHSSFTHRKELSPKSTRNARGLLHELAKCGRLGGLIAQFPYSFTNTGANRLHLVKLGEIFSGFPLLVELRHGSWDFKGFGEFLLEHSLIPVNVDLPRLRQFTSFRADVSRDLAYFRLHGRNEKGWLVDAMDARYDYQYNTRELLELKRKIFRAAERSRKVVVVFNNTTGGKAIANAFQLQAMLGDEKNGRIPANAVNAFPFLRSIAPKGVEATSPDLFREAM